MSSRPGKHCHIHEMAKELNYTQTQIKQAISNKRHESKEWGSHVKTVIQGSVFSWIEKPENGVPEPKDVKKNLYEQIGVTKNGDLILQDEDGNLFRATELA